jgi:adenylate kinase
MIHIVLFGPPGAGKGTQSEKIIEKFNFTHISTGNLLRKEISLETELGILAKSFIDKGELVPDEVVIGMIKKFLSSLESSKGCVWDGFPRTVAQAEALDNLLKERNENIETMISLKVPDNELVKRLIERGLTSGRSDDNEETITKRIKTYNLETTPVADYYNNQDKLNEINGLGTIEEIFSRIEKLIILK